MSITNDLHEVLNLMMLAVQEISNKDQSKDELINTLIDGYVFISKELALKKLRVDELEIIEKLESTLVSIVEYFNSGENHQGEYIIENNLHSLFNEWREIAARYLRYKVVICGINN